MGTFTSPQVRRKRGRPRDPEADGRILAAASVADPAARLRQHDRRRSRQQRRRRQGHGLPSLGRKEDLAVAAMERLYRDEMPAPDTGSIRGRPRGARRLGAHVRELAGRHRLRAHHDQGVDARRRIAHALPRGQRAGRADARGVYERAIERGEVRADIPVTATVQFIGGLVGHASDHASGHADLDEVDELVDLMLDGIGSDPSSAGTSSGATGDLSRGRLSPGRAGRRRRPRGRTVPGRRHPRRDRPASRGRPARAGRRRRCRPWPSRRAW